jgi:diguanylate cyclase (GGDEF)-like protein
MMFPPENMSADASKMPPAEPGGEAVLPEYAAEWLGAQRALADTTNLALVTVGESNDFNAGVANNTSVCEAFYATPRAALCAEFCGRARERALAEGRTVSYRCHAGLHCFAAPLRVPGEPPTLALIGGRVFLSAREYREFLRRETEAGGALGPQAFSNLKFTEQQELEHAQQLILSAAHEILTHSAEQRLLTEAGRLLETPADFGAAADLAAWPAAAAPAPERPALGLSGSSPQPAAEPPPLPPEQRELFFNGSFEEGCREAMRLFGARFHIRSGALLMRSGRRLMACAAGGAEREHLIGLRLDAASPLLARLRGEAGARGGQPFALALAAAERAALGLDAVCAEAVAFAFPIGDELSGVLLTLDTPLDEAARRELLAVGQEVIVPLELARLRGEVTERTHALAQWQDFAHLLATRASAAETYAAIVDKAAATLGAERVSLLVLHDETQRLVCKAARGLTEDVMTGPALGEGIAGAVLESGEPLVVGEVSEQAWVLERTRGTYRTGSFISFPIQSGGRQLAVLNVTERTGDGRFGEGDLAWLRRFAPYAAAALERIDLREKAQRFQLLAITDPLTGLLNRRYLEERFAEEVERAKRYQYPLSFAMMDIDGFKAYNDTYGHQAGDDVLRATAQCIRSSLRNFDVAARYGGEEFILVLPETETAAAAALAERLRGRVEQYFRRTQPAQPVTVSVGIASLSLKLQTKHQIIRAADQALYAAKKRGKNCVVVYNTDLEPGLS